MHITSFNISTKKGDSQTLRWLVVHETPHPRIGAEGGYLQWQNGDGLFPHYGNPATGLAAKYHCYLLAPGELPENYDRTHFAGYVPCSSAANPSPAPTPGTMTLRGKDLGEMTVHFFPNGGPDIFVRCTERATGQERAFIEEHIIPKLAAFIAENKAALREDAIRRIIQRFNKEFAEKRTALAKLEDEAAKCIGMLTRK